MASIEGGFCQRSGQITRWERSRLACWIRFSRWCIGRGACAGRYQAFSNDRHENRYKLYELVIQREKLDHNPIDLLEFGVYKGDSMYWWVRRISHPDARFVGFDTFTGLPERWPGTAPQGTFGTQGKAPQVEDPRCHFEAGLFQDTVPRFLRGFSRNSRLVVHLDADLYGSTLFVLISLASVFEPGDLLFFDEFADPSHEFRAFDDFTKAYQLRYEVMGEVNNFNQVCLKIT